MLEVHDLHYRYEDGHEALKGISFTLNDGEKTALVGANGSGKSTLLLHIAGALKVQSGRIMLNASTGLIFQDSDDQLLMPSVIEDVSFTLTARGMNMKSAYERSMKILSELGISHLSSRPPHKLSGGEKRMVTIAGVLASEPELLLLDEPTSGLDPKARRRVINFLSESDKTILLASHD
ncbi:MAG: ABC transporter ATP-binding protein, partial [Synergistaceae bacterium]|nr:ABC transporter ATP-binding protein [Synergistaceae bacterium]